MNHLSSWKWRHATTIVGVLAAALFVVPFAGSASAQSGDTGDVRVMHASPDAPAVDIFVDGEKAVTALGFGTATPYVGLPTGSHNVKVFASPSDGTGAPVLEADLDVAAGADYTVLALGRVSDGSLSLLPLDDDNTTPAAGQAHVRLVHASPDAPAVDVFVAGTSTKVFENVPFASASPYTPVAAGVYDLEVKAAGSDATALTLNDVTVAPQTVYTVVAIGLLGNNSLQAVPLVDATAPVAGSADASTDATPVAPSTGLVQAEEGDGSINLFLIGLIAVLTFGGSAVAIAYARNR